MAIASDTPARTRKPRGQGASRRGEILSAATRIFLEEGVANATMRRIAAAVGVSSTALYVYFPDKDAILQAIAEATFAELLGILEASQQGADTPLERLRAGLRAYVQFGLTRPDEYRLIFLTAKRPEPDDWPTVQDAHHSFAILQRCVQDLMDRGIFRPGSSELTAEAIWACLHGVTLLVLDKRQHLSSVPDDLIGRVIDMAVGGCL